MWSGVRIELVTDQQALGDLQKPWASLLARTPAATGFHSLAWIATCRAALKSTARLWTLVVRDGSETVAIVPTELEHGRLRFIGERVSNYLGPVFDPDRLERIVFALAGFLAAERAIDLVDFRGLRETSPFLAALAGIDVPHWSCGSPMQTASCPFADLRAGWDEMYAHRSSSFRGNIARKWKALARLGRVEFTETADPDAVRTALDAMFGLFRGRWAGRHESGGFAGERRAFHAEAAPALAAAGHLSLASLTLDDELVAFHYGVRAGGVTSSYVLAHDNALNVCSPGQVLLVRTLEAAARRGDAEYDFAVGEEPYKETWASGRRAVFRLLRWRRHRLAGIDARARGLGTRLWVAARSVDRLRQLRREGLLRALRKRISAPDAPGFPAGRPGTWHVYALDRVPDVDATFSLERWSYATMRRWLSPRLLDLAVDRAFRGDELLMLRGGKRLVGIVWRASMSRRELVAGRAVPADAAVYYQPVAAGGSDLDEVVRGLAAITRNAAPVIVVAGTPLAGPNTRSLGCFAADHRFTPLPASMLSAPLPR